VRPLDLAVVAPHGEGALLSRLGRATDLAFGGAEVQMALLTVGLARRGHRVSLLCSGAGPGLESEELDGIGLLRVPGRGRAYHAALRRALDRAAAAVVYQRCALPLTGRLARLCAATGRRFVFGVANDRDVDGRARQALGLARYLLYRHGLARADLAIAQSRSQLRHLRRLRRRPSILLPSLFDAAAIRPRPQPDEPLILWVGHLLPKKRPLLLAEMARSLPGLRFVAVGSPRPDPALAEAFRSAVRDLPNLTYEGLADTPALAALYDRATLLLNTSLAEGMPNTFLEAWSREVPVATVGVDPDGLLQDKGLGIVLGEGDPAAGLGEALRTPAALQEAGRRGRQHVLARHQPDAVLSRLEEALLNGGEPQPHPDRKPEGS
jgi:glycosyltransferase involved in cell wall biosynthesis